MALTGYSELGVNLGPVDFIELQWNRKWASCGNFVIYMAASSYNPAVKYVSNDGRPETGIVQKVVSERKSNGRFITLSGFFVHKVADMGTSYKTLVVNGNNGKSTKENITEYLEATMCTTADGYSKQIQPFLCDWNIDDSSVFPGKITASVDRGVGAGEGLYQILTDSENGASYSYYCTPIFAETAELQYLGLNYVFVQGRDLRNEVYFGDAFGNVSNIQCSRDESNAKFGYISMQKVESLDGWTDVWPFTHTEIINGETVNYICLSGGYYPLEGITGMGWTSPNRVIEVEIDEVELVPENAELIRDIMVQKWYLDMLNYRTEENIEVAVIQNKYYYLKDYDLGDICTVYVEEQQKMYTARIVEVREVHAANKVDVEIVLGTPRQATWRKIAI